MPMTDEELRAFVREEVWKSLADREVLDSLWYHCTARLIASLRVQTGYTPRNIEYKGKDKDKPQEIAPDLPTWLKGLDR